MSQSINLEATQTGKKIKSDRPQSKDHSSNYNFPPTKNKITTLTDIGIDLIATLQTKIKS